MPKFRHKLHAINNYICKLWKPYSIHGHSDFLVRLLQVPSLSLLCLFSSLLLPFLSYATKWLSTQFSTSRMCELLPSLPLLLFLMAVFYICLPLPPPPLFGMAWGWVRAASVLCPFGLRKPPQTKKKLQLKGN